MLSQSPGVFVWFLFYCFVFLLRLALTLSSKSFQLLSTAQFQSHSHTLGICYSSAPLPSVSNLLLYKILPQTYQFKTTNIYYLMVSKSQEFGINLVEWFWLSFFHKVTIKMLRWSSSHLKAWLGLRISAVVWVFCPPRFMLKSYLPEVIVLSRWGLWEVIRLWGGSPHERD